MSVCRQSNSPTLVIGTVTVGSKVTVSFMSYWYEGNRREKERQRERREIER